MNVEAWLEQIDLGQYAELFADNRIGFDVLHDLTESDLKGLGVPLGDRKRLLRAIVSLADQVDNQAPNETHATRSTEAERRQLTVMFCDLVGSTALSGAMDPEDYREVIRVFQEGCAGVVKRFEGYVAKYLGDGILIYFGYPHAHEDDAERAVRAGLDMVGVVAALKPRPDLTLASRIGIATGLVVVGDMVGQGISEERAVSGETPNLAARLQVLAEPDTVIISAGTHALIEGLFICEDLGPQSLEGISEPVSSYRVREETVVRSRFEAATRRGLVPLVGREHEIGLLEERWQQAKEGDGQVVLLMGEAGIGKSRIAQILHERMAEEDHIRLDYQCSPYHINSPLHPIIEQLARTSKFGLNDTPEIRLGKLEALLDQSSDHDEEVIPLFAALLSIPTDDRYTALEMTPELQKEKLFSVLVNQMNGLAARQPLLIIFEDAHWIDPSTLEFLGRLVEQVEVLPVLILVTFRPEFTAPWMGQTHVSMLALNRLSRRQSLLMVEQVAGARGLTEPVRDEIIDKTDGVPLFIEEFTRTLVEMEDRETSTPGRAARVTVPATLQDSLMARLDRLTIGKRIAQTGAAIGREFTRELLESVCGLDKTEFDRGLDELVGSGLVFRRGAGPTATYVFKHALLQEAAYSSLLLASRRPLHRRIAEALTNHSPEQSALLAHHWERAENLDHAFHHRIKAAERAANLHAQWEAVAQYWAALELLDRLPETLETCLRHVDTVVAIIRVREGSFWQTEEERRLAQRHLDKAMRTAAVNKDFASLSRLEAFKGVHWLEEVLLAEAVKHADASGDKVAQAEVGSRYSGYLGQIGRFEDSISYAHRTIEIYGQLGENVRQGLAMAGEGRCFSARAGRLEDSLRYASRARKIAETTDDLQLKTWLAMESEAYIYKGLWEETVRVAEEGLPDAWELGDWFVVLFTSSWAAIACVKLGRLKDARRFLDKTLTGFGQRVGFDYPQAYFRMALGQVQLASGETEMALMTAHSAVEMAERGGYLLEQGAAYRTLGQVYEASGHRPEAETAFCRSLEILGEIQSRPELGQSLLSHGRFKIEEDAGEGKRFLKCALDLFEEIDATGWIEETRAALALA